MLYLKIICLFEILCLINYINTSSLDVDLNIHSNHLPYVLFSEKSQNHSNPLKHCWGYEENCSRQYRFSEPNCPGFQTGWASSKSEQIDTFYNQGDFGYVKQQKEKLTFMCEPTDQGDSSLQCSSHLQFCRGHKIMIDFKNMLNYDRPVRYKMDILSHGQIGGKCKFYKKKLDDESDHLGALQSWSPELRFFATINKYPGKCDLIISKPTFIMKIDATVNMYHHFCDFLNLYASQHVNSSDSTLFSKDVHILIWESYPYESAFSDTFAVFTNHAIWNLNTFKGQVVCFDNLVLPLLPRMIFGLFYNTPLIEGCEKSGLFKAFSEHVLHRLEISRKITFNEKIKITFLSRNTRYRNVINENELILALKKNSDYEVKRVIYSENYLSFKKQILRTHNSDIFIGMHGAGLTHLLFLPDWAVIFELYNCEDEHCYKDLSRLRGIKYITWQDTNMLTIHDENTFNDNAAHAKFVNYSFNKEEFLRLVAEAARHVKKNKLIYSAKVYDEL
ncbi:EGF domain-specific O-linked N-acetylglucosamine transferase [Daktulosphaira vitifoliae]|uniref:EGF domain-specific O-linked N-acetylglucosamine transferase n=1 Tax=Daktulosphaira vitifoliae TaxID=58002 RepID=UPI0021A9E398|nr:EGF domain-specific O-linked N-acetylglucosamine transferase [Daktulosphaira vitifoliae]